MVKLESIFKLLLLLSLLMLTACDQPIQQMGPTEYGMRFRKLPPVLGGGVSRQPVSPGEYAIVWPWEAIYRFDTAIQQISWGDAGSGSRPDQVDYVHTRALDGNEVALAVTVQYRVTATPEKLLRLVRYVATDDAGVRRIVEAVARADIRTWMNELRTSEFFDRDARYRAIDKVRTMMNTRLNPDGIIVDKVILDEHRFERLLSSGQIDRSYQEQIDETQKLGQDTEREKLRIETVKARKEQELNETQAKVNRLIAEAEGYKDQARVRGDAYFEAKENDAKAILAAGRAEVEGLKEQIQALSGQGGKAILKLQLARELAKNKPKFVVLGESKEQGGIEVRKVDTNDLLRQAGIFEALKDDPVKKNKQTTQSAKK